jgi:hypothetical protein
MSSKCLDFLSISTLIREKVDSDKISAERCKQLLEPGNPEMAELILLVQAFLGEKETSG